MRHTRAILFSLLLLILGPALHAQNEPYIVRPTVHPCVNVRTEASATASSIECLTPGTVVTVIESVPFWRKVKFGNNQEGWIAKKYIEPAGSISADTINASDAGNIPANAFLTIHYVDVGQGDGILIQTYDDGIQGNGKFEGYSIVIDCGPYKADASNPFLKYVKDLAHRNADIEALFISHPHSDHFYGAEGIATQFSINHYYDPGYPKTLVTYTNFVKSMKGTAGTPGLAKKVHIGKANFGTINWGSELKVEVLYSWVGDPNNELSSGNTEENNSSIVIRVQYGDNVFLFMGDAEGKERDDDAETAQFVEKILLATVPTKLKATVLKIAHHGSETSSTLPFIRAVDPDIVVVQSGRKKFRQTFLPDMSTLQRYCDQNHNVRIYRTDEGDEAAGFDEKQAVDGDHIIIKSNGRGKPQVQAVGDGRFCR